MASEHPKDIIERLLSDGPWHDYDELCEEAASKLKTQQTEIERLQKHQAHYDHQWSQIAQFLGGDAHGVPEPYEKSMVGRVKYEIERLREAIEKAASAPGIDWLTEQLELGRVLTGEEVSDDERIEPR